MNKKDFKKLIKPIVKECIHEAILESGLLSNVISEVVKGLGVQMLSEQKSVKRTEEKNKAIVGQKRKPLNKELVATRKKLLESINKDAYGGVDVFEGTTPMRAGASASTPAPSGPLSDVAPSDPGVDISGILNIGGDKWSKLV